MVGVLLVEDDVSLRKQIRFSLEYRFDLFEAGDRGDALNILHNRPIHIMILDLGLPPLDNTPEEGLEVLRHCLAEHSCKVIILTGQKTEGIALDAIRLGAFDYLLKPVNMEQLIHSLERAILFREAEEEIARQGVQRISFDVEVGKGLQPLRDEASKHIIIKVLKDTDFNIHKAARILGVKRESLYYFVKKFGLKRYED
jgi:two-component system, response regulator RegA